MKIKFSKWWILVLPIVFSLHLQKVLLFIFMLLTWHEAMHILCARKLGYECSEVIVYPFGLSARIKNFEMKNSKYEILITLAGLSVHIVMYFLLFAIMRVGWISYYFMEYLNTMNIQILFFNLLPIYPLDGGRLLGNVYELLFPYKKAKLLTLLSSFLMLSLYIASGLLASVSGMIITLFFILQLGMHSITYRAHCEQFYLYRYLHGPLGKLKIHRQNDIYKNRHNMIVKNQQIKSEREFLSHYI